MHLVAGTGAQFEAQRGRLFSIAYRILGCPSDAEDAVQDAYLRWRGAAGVHDAVAYLARVVTRLAVDRLRSARSRREICAGPGPPEPSLTEDGALGPAQTAERRESVSFAVRLLLERLSPAERAVFVLREAFAYSHRDIAVVLELSEVNCRQLHVRARQHMGKARSRFDPDHQQRSRLVERFLAAAREGDLRGLEQTLAADMTS
jgi:RNA polymerase sigma factor (sigma-70 family)